MTRWGAWYIERRWLLQHYAALQDHDLARDVGHLGQGHGVVEAHAVGEGGTWPRRYACGAPPALGQIP